MDAADRRSADSATKSRCIVELTAWLDRIEYPIDLRVAEDAVAHETQRALASVLDGFEIEIDRCDCTLLTDRGRLSRLFQQHHAARVEAAKAWQQRAQDGAASKARRDWPGVSADTRRALRAHEEAAEEAEEVEKDAENPTTDEVDMSGDDAGDRPRDREEGERADAGIRTLTTTRCTVDIAGQDRLSADLRAEAEEAVELALDERAPWLVQHLEVRIICIM